MVLALPTLNDTQHALMVEVVAALRTAGVQSVRPQLGAATNEQVWLSPPLLAVAAAMIQVITTELDERPWEISDDLWTEYLPDRRPVGRTEWRKATYALQAAGCLAAGMWLEVGKTESFWHNPLWPEALDVIELLCSVVTARTSLSLESLAGRISTVLGLQSPARSDD